MYVMMMKHFSFSGLLAVLVFLGCTKNTVPDPNGTTTTPTVTAPQDVADPIQYGTPFGGVPATHDVVMYQVNMRVFSSGGDFKGVVARLDSIKGLGVNMVYLMPIYPVGVLKGVNSPYSVSDYKAVGSEFGSLDDLRALVDGAHSRGIAVMLDWVGNHTAFDHVWIKGNYTSWYVRDAMGVIQNPPPGWADVAQLDFSNANMRLAEIKAMRYWVLAGNVDGFRFDYADGPPYDFLKQMIDNLNTITSHKLLMLAEGFSNNYFFKAGFQLKYGGDFYYALKDKIFAGKQSVKILDGIVASDYANALANSQIMHYTNNHDTNGSEGTPLELFGGERGSMATFVVSAYIGGIPMIYNGQEIGEATRLTFPFLTTKIHWSQGNSDLTLEYKKILAFRAGSGAVKQGVLTSYSSDDVCAFTKVLGGETVLVLANLRNRGVDYVVPSGLVNSGWVDGMTGGAVQLGGTVSLGAYGYLILKRM